MPLFAFGHDHPYPTDVVIVYVGVNNRFNRFIAKLAVIRPGRPGLIHVPARVNDDDAVVSFNKTVIGIVVAKGHMHTLAHLDQARGFELLIEVDEIWMRRRFRHLERIYQ